MKLVDDLLKDNDGAWDAVRIVGLPTLIAGLSATIKAMWVDISFADHAVNYGLGIAGQLGAYAGAVVGHAMAKK